MTTKIILPNLENLINRYHAGETVDSIASSIGINRKTLYKAIKESGATKTKKTMFDNPDNIIKRYTSGESVKSIAESEKVSRGVITRFLKERNIEVRPLSESQKIYMSKTTHEFRQKITEKAHAAVRGKTKSIEQKIANSLSKETITNQISQLEINLVDLLKDANIAFTQQKSVHIYNIDIAIHEPAIAVEIFGGNWHSHGRHAERFEERVKYLLNSGWHVVIVWAKRTSIMTGCYDYLLSFMEELRLNPPTTCQYRVISIVQGLTRSRHKFALCSAG